MTRKIKALGLALVAALALTAVMASAASAQFTSAASHTVLSGEQTVAHEFSAGSGFGGIKCKTAKFSGTSAAKSTHRQVVTPTYGECEDSFGRIVDITKNTLSYSFQSGVTAGETKGHVETTGEIVLEVTSNKVTVCKVTIKGTQTNNGISYTNNKDGTVTTKTNTNNVVSSTVGNFFSCGISEGTHTGGTYTGETLMKGTSGGSAVAISVH
jgi:hypothetical protein